MLSRFFISIIDTETLGVDKDGTGVNMAGMGVEREATGLEIIFMGLEKDGEKVGVRFDGVRMRFEMVEIAGFPLELGLRNTVPLKQEELNIIKKQ